MLENRRAPVLIAFLAALAIAVMAPALVAQDAPAAPAEAVAPAPGLALTIQPLDAAGAPAGAADTRSVRMIALNVPQGTAASSLAVPGRFRATWTGNLNLKLRERFA